MDQANKYQGEQSVAKHRKSVSTAPACAALARSASVYKAQWFSDHALLAVEYDFVV